MFREIEGKLPGKLQGVRNNKDFRVLEQSVPYPAAQRCFVWKKLARLWWQRRHQDQASSSVALRGGGHSRKASK